MYIRCKKSYFYMARKTYRSSVTVQKSGSKVSETTVEAATSKAKIFILSLSIFCFLYLFACCFFYKILNSKKRLLFGVVGSLNWIDKAFGWERRSAALAPHLRRKTVAKRAPRSTAEPRMSVWCQRATHHNNVHSVHIQSRTSVINNP